MKTARLTEFMARMDQDAVAVLFSAPEILRNGDNHFEWRQDSDFYFLTRLDEPESVAVLRPSHPTHKYVLFVRPRKREEEIWTGIRTGVEGAVANYGADAAYETGKLSEELPTLLEGHSKLYYRLGHRERNDKVIVSTINKLKEQIRRGAEWPVTILDPGSILDEQRLRKNEAELADLREATRISAAGHVEAMKACHPGMFEYELEAVVEYVFHKLGSQTPGYSSIVGAGFNTTILHYNTNRGRINDGDLVLIDAGAEYNLYTGDITRTFPANGKFTKAQREVYEIVLAAQKAVIGMVKPGVSFMALHDRAVEVVAEGLLKLGLLSGTKSEVIERGDYKKFFMHRTGHWLGLDVHDVGRYRVNDAWRTLEPGMVFTVEPGIYIAEGTEGVPSEYYNIGIRIEDDLLVTADGYEVLTSGVPKEIDEIEALMKEKAQVAY
jgi:Xaa-Pro aminopeptidase